MMGVVLWKRGERVRSCLHRHRWLALLVALALVRGILYATIVPPWQTPDETGHFEYVWMLAHLRRVPAREDASSGFEGQLIDSLYRWRFGDYTSRSLPDPALAAVPQRLKELPHTILARRARTLIAERFSLAYVVQALATLPLLGKGLEAQLYAARLSSVLLNAWIVAAAYLTFEALFPERGLVAILAAGIVLLSPQHTFINATVGDGTLAEAGAALAIYGWVRALGRRFGALGALAIAAGTAVANLSKNTAVFLIAADLALALWWAARSMWSRRRGWRWWQAVPLALTVLLLAGALWVWQGSTLGERAARLLDPAALSPDQWAWVDERGISLGEGLLVSHDSLWANFGWMNMPLSDRWYGAMLGLSTLALVGWLLRGRSGQGQRGLGHSTWDRSFAVHTVVVEDRVSPAPTGPGGATGKLRSGAAAWMPRWQPAMMLLFAAAALGVYLWVALLSRADGYYQFQGRYLFPVIVPWAYFLAGGAVRLVGKREAPLYLALVLLVLLDAWAMAMYILPYYYG